MNIGRLGTPRFEDYSQVYFADACEELEAAAARGEVTLRSSARGDYPGARLPDGLADGIRTVGSWNAQRPQTWGLDWHRNEGIEITHLDRGSLCFSTRDASWDLRPGDLTVTRPWQEHRVGGPSVGPSHLRWVIVDVEVRRPHQPWRWPSWIGLTPADLERLTTLLQRHENPVWAGGPAVRSAFTALEESSQQHGSRTFESELRLSTSNVLLAVLRLLDTLPARADEGLTSPSRAVQMFLAELDQHLDHRWTLGEMAEACGMGRSQFSTRCRELTNMTPVEFLTFRRLERSAQVLRAEPRRAVLDIAIQHGFGSSQYFATSFRRHFGVSPSDFRHHPGAPGTGAEPAA